MASDNQTVDFDTNLMQYNIKEQNSNKQSLIPRSLNSNEHDQELGINTIKGSTYQDFVLDTDGSRINIMESDQFESQPGAPKPRCFRRIVLIIDDIDVFYSKKIHNLNNRVFEALVYIPAQAFNRKLCIYTSFIAFLVGWLRYTDMLSNLGYKSDYALITAGEQARLATCLVVFYALCMIFSVTSTQVLKYTIKRQRPDPPQNTVRWMNQRNMEKGTFAMPSGDSGAGAVFCMVMTLVPGVTYCMLILPFVMLGRVYYHCHWLGDTICGATIGLLWSLILFKQFELFVPFMQLIAGDQFFITEQ